MKLAPFLKRVLYTNAKSALSFLGEGSETENLRRQHCGKQAGRSLRPTTKRCTNLHTILAKSGGLYMSIYKCQNKQTFIVNSIHTCSWLYFFRMHCKYIYNCRMDGKGTGPKGCILRFYYCMYKSI